MSAQKVPSSWTGADGEPGVPATASGTVGNLSFAQLAKMLQPYFASASLFTAPGASVDQTGGRTTALTTGGPYVSSVNGQGGAVTALDGQVGTGALVAGTFTWTYPQGAFAQAPAVFAFAVGAGNGLYCSSAPGVSSAVIASGSGSDTRTIFLLAVSL